ncbi:MAG: hypothetical protein GYA17_17405 [Chloroflexi bacterium]|nr:hypothetical protein [Chloroflexota bacterium]
MKRLLGPILLAVLILGVGAAIFISVRQQITLRQVVPVRGLIGSEKEPFFKDPRVIDVLRKHGFEVQVEKAGSRTIATDYDLQEYDFAFPAGVPAAEKIRQNYAGSKSYDVFFTPMAIASWEDIAQILVANGVAQDQGDYYTLDMHGYLDWVSEGKRWSDLQHNADYPVNKSVLIVSTDVRKSNSAAMYLALASYIANGDNVVQNNAEIQTVQPLVESLFLKQGYTEYSSEAPFEDYLVMGAGKAPLVMIYEAQFISQAAQGGGLSDQMALMYPEPTIYSKHIFVSLGANGERLGELLLNDPELQRLAVEYGFRNSDQAYFKEFTRSHQVNVPDTLVDVIEPPSYEILERMIQEIEQKYQ